MSLRETALLAVILINAVPVVAAYFRHSSGLAWWATAMAAGAMSGFLALLWRLVSLGPEAGTHPWMLALVAAGVPVLLAGYLFSGILGRQHASLAFKLMGKPFAVLLALGTLVLIFLPDRGFVSGYTWTAGTGTIQLGPIGKAYVSYLLVGAVLVGFNLESAFRLARGPARDRLQPVILGQFGVLGFLVYVLTTGLVYSAVELDNLVALVVPLSVASLLTGYRFVRGTLADTSVPVSRNVVYSSFTALVATLYFLAMGAAAQLATLTGWTPGHVVTASFIFLVVLVAFLFFFSNRFKRGVRRFIDRNFYVNRYDYRRHWARATEVLGPAQPMDELLETTEGLLKDLFLADDVSIALKDKGSRLYRVRRGKGKDNGEAVLEPGDSLLHRLFEEQRAFLRPRSDNGGGSSPWIVHTASGAVAPLLSGSELIGVVGLERHNANDQFTSEDLELLDCTLAQITAVLRGAQLGTELADAREMELLAQWSNMLVHDFKNYLSPLRLIVQNMRVHMANPEFQKEAVEDIAGVTDRMETLVRRLAEFRRGLPPGQKTLDVGAMAEETLAALKVRQRPALTVEVRFIGDVGVQGDGDMLRRVVENLITNAVDAMDGGGVLTLSTEAIPSTRKEGLDFVFTVSDTGAGMDKSFMSDRLFRPFATTKKKGLGLGLYQCRSIVEAHGGEIHASSNPGEGSMFRVFLPAVPLNQPQTREMKLNTVMPTGRTEWKSQPR